MIVRIERDSNICELKKVRKVQTVFEEENGFPAEDHSFPTIEGPGELVQE